ncbi:hypothetical protein [Leifsonia sp. Leaf264]|uniref:hypothetical protein n=1 Tax=Leifsonia sp. Leaf264 TaxID=1736314 RepID=UPI0006FCA641|nr:hypothetical protein [Leifsonia sp. Leaf264]KQO98544.1 hypothetical protein ASF30_10810 [Leifsonia sp. Leaf264]
MSGRYEIHVGYMTRELRITVNSEEAVHATIVQLLDDPELLIAAGYGIDDDTVLPMLTPPTKLPASVSFFHAVVIDNDPRYGWEFRG